MGVKREHVVVERMSSVATQNHSTHPLHHHPPLHHRNMNVGPEPALLSLRSGEEGASIQPYTIVTVRSGGNARQASVDLCDRNGGDAGSCASSIRL